jgi:hypothetical protein
LPCNEGLGRNKVGLIRSNAILRWNYERFEEYLGRPDTRLMAIGYGFADDHINGLSFRIVRQEAFVLA